MEFSIPGFVFFLIFYLFYAIRTFPLPAFITKGMYEKELETLNAFIRGVGMFVGIYGINTFLFNFWDEVMGENFMLAFLIHIGLFFLVKIVVDITVWKIGKLWVRHLLVYILWFALIIGLSYLSMEAINYRDYTLFYFVYFGILIVGVWWLYAKYFHRPWRFSGIKQNTH